VTDEKKTVTIYMVETYAKFPVLESGSYVEHPRSYIRVREREEPMFNMNVVVLRTGFKRSDQFPYALTAAGAWKAYLLKKKRQKEHQLGLLDKTTKQINWASAQHRSALLDEKKER